MTPSDLVKVKNPEIRALHLTWIAFFLCFYTWFNMAPLATTMARNLGWLTPQDLSLLAICNVALTIPARILVGMALDRWGPRSVFSALMMTMSVPTLLFAFGNTLTQLLVTRLIMGCIGASFVIGIHMTSLWFSPKDIGFASGVYAGWGNAGAAAAAIVLPAIALSLFGGEAGWRYAIATTGVMTFFYGLYYRFAVTDGPAGTFLRKPRKAVTIEVSCEADMIKLILYTLPIMGVSTLLIWKAHQRGYLNLTHALITYTVIAGIVTYQVVHVLKVNLPLLKKGIPEDDRYPFNNVIAIGVAYFSDFGAGLAVISMLPIFFEQTFHLTPTKTGLIVSSFAFVNLFARPLGGTLSDRLGSRKKVLQFYLFGIAACFFVMGTINDRWPMAMVVLITVLCAFFVHGSSGVTFSILPLIKRRLTGQISGTVGAYGNVGAMIYLTLYSVVAPQTFFFVLAAGACVSFLICFFFLEEPTASFADEYYLSSVDRDIEGETLLRNVKLDIETSNLESLPLGEEQITMNVAHDDSFKAKTR